MKIKIEGYVIDTHGEHTFTIKIINDNLNDRKFKLNKESAKIYIHPYLYPCDLHDVFEQATGNQKEHINQCLGISRHLMPGDLVNCSVFVVDKSSVISENPNDIETYIKHNIWLYPYPEEFNRIDGDTKDTIKFRKHKMYKKTNTEKTNLSSWELTDKWWGNKNPKIVFPIVWYINIKDAIKHAIKTIFENKNINKTSIVMNIILGIVSIILIIVTGWVLIKK